MIDTPAGLLGFVRAVPGQASITVLVSTLDDPVEVPGVSGTVLLDSTGGTVSGAGFAGRLAARQAIIVESGSTD